MAATPISRPMDTGEVVVSTPLPPFRAIDLLPELAALADEAGVSGSDGAAFLAIAKKLGGGKARHLIPQVLAGTKITVTENGQPMPILLNTVEAFDLAFDGRMGLIAPVIAMALEVSFRDFFDGFAQLAKRLKAPAP